MPYRIDIPAGGDGALDRLVDLGALDVETVAGGLAALLPDSVTPEAAAHALGLDRVRVSPAIGRDEGSIWILSPRPVRIGSLRIVPAHLDAQPGSLRLIDAAAFGTGLHPTTALCLEALEDAVRLDRVETVLDVGTGSGILAFAALRLGVPRATAIDIDDDAVRAAGENARLNRLDGQLEVTKGTPETTAGRWPLVLANVLTAPLIEMAPALARLVGHHGQLILSGVRASLADDVTRAYVRVGMQRVDARSRDGWVAVILRASW